MVLKPSVKICIPDGCEKMPVKEPVIKFSPFEALLIGEKNNILKRQPMKNTIFVTKLKRRRKSINLRDLFGVENGTKTDESEVIFKMPQRVCDFLKDRKLQNKKNSSIKGCEKDKILCYECEGCKMISNKNNKTVLRNSRTVIVKLNKMKFKENNLKKIKYKNSVMHRVVKKFPRPVRRRNHCDSACKSVGLKNIKRYALRGKDGKFICKTEYEKLKSAEISPKQKYLSNYLHQLYLKKNKRLTNAQFRSNKNSPDLELPYSLEALVGLPDLPLDITTSEFILNEVLEYYRSDCQDFRFPQYPKQLEPFDFESDSNLIDIIYENFPKIVKFESQNEDSDFSVALFNAGILTPEKRVRMYKKKTNGFIQENRVQEVMVKRFPVIKLRRINEIVPNLYPIENRKAIFRSNIDEPYTRESHLIQTKSFRSFFFQSAEGKDIFIGNLIKPFFQNSWFGSLPES